MWSGWCTTGDLWNIAIQISGTPGTPVLFFMAARGPRASVIGRAVASSACARIIIATLAKNHALKITPMAKSVILRLWQINIIKRLPLIRTLERVFRTLKCLEAAFLSWHSLKVSNKVPDYKSHRLEEQRKREMRRF